MTDSILVSRPEAMRLAGTTSNNLRMLVARGRLVEGDALIEGTVRKGVTLASMAAHYGWSPCDRRSNPDSTRRAAGLGRATTT